MLSEYFWDFENRPIGADTTGDGVTDVANQYDADGIRVAQTVNGQETRFLIDANRPYARVLEEYTPGRRHPPCQPSGQQQNGRPHPARPDGAQDWRANPPACPPFPAGLSPRSAPIRLVRMERKIDKLTRACFPLASDSPSARGGWGLLGVETQVFSCNLC